MNPAIVYLAQNTLKDVQYGRDSRSMLKKSLDLLFANYNDRFKHDVLIFHEGDFRHQDQGEIRKGRNEIRFVEVQFAIPSFLQQHEIPEIWTDGKGSNFGMGHRHMIRFYALQIFDILSDMGYDWFFRMDDDSFIHSRIDYDIFAFMADHGYEYGYRVDILEADSCSRGFEQAVIAYLTAEGIAAPLFHRAGISHFRKAMVLGEALVAWLTDKTGTGSDKLQAVPRSCYNRRSYYNNFFITNVHFWKRPEPQSFLHYLDRIGGGYKYRWNDLIIQSATVQIFLQQQKIYKFRDWTYEHATVKNGKLHWGGIYQGCNDQNSEAVKQFIQTYGTTRLPRSWSY